ncbi:hypothetical protein PHET_04866 [Paragonimus heterotremus]|uniref:CKK domain-containing protein n=1 Tax=Paragonimus heterotremus TaxID=100268 RepID=A0A8J4TC27_9TREM|nr:hypothetical protein PHET_04866 [Paragonimus heterotremus]
MNPALDQVDPHDPNNASTVVNSHEKEPVERTDVNDDLLKNLVQAASRIENLSNEDAKDVGRTGYYVARQHPESTDFMECSPASPKTHSTLERNNLYATFSKRPSPAVSDKLPVIGSPKRIRSSKSSSKPSSTTVSPPCSKPTVPCLRSEFENRRRSRSVLSAEQAATTKSSMGTKDPPPGTTTWAASGGNRKATKQNSLPDSTADRCISPSSTACPNSSEKEISRGSAVAVRMFLDQRRRAIELGRQRALLANSKAVAERHHAAFQRLLQSEQRRRAKKDDASCVSECEKTTSIIDSQAELEPSLPVQLPSAETVEEPIINADLTPTARFPGEQITDVNEDLSTLSVDALCKPNQSPVGHIDLTEDRPSQPVADSSQQSITDNLTSSASPHNTSLSDHSDLLRKSRDSGPFVSSTNKTVDSTTDCRSSSDARESRSSRSGSDRMECTPSLVVEQTDYNMSGQRLISSPCATRPTSQRSRPRQSTPQPHLDETMSPRNGHFANRKMRREDFYAPPPAECDYVTSGYPTYPGSLAGPHASSHSPSRAQIRRIPYPTQSHPNQSGYSHHRPPPQHPSRRHVSRNQFVASVDYEWGGPKWTNEREQEDDFYYDGADELGDDEPRSSDSGEELDMQSNYSHGLWEADRYSDRSFPVTARSVSSQPFSKPFHSLRHSQTVRHRRPFSPLPGSLTSTTRRRPTRSSHSGVNAATLSELNRNIADLQSGLERLTLLASGSNVSVGSLAGGPHLMEQQTPAYLLNSNTSLSGSTRAQWSDRPKLRQLNADLPLEHSPEPTFPIVTDRIDTDVQTVSSHSDKQPSDLQPTSTAAVCTRSIGCSLLVDKGVDPTSPFVPGSSTAVTEQVTCSQTSNLSDSDKQRDPTEKAGVHVTTEPNQFFIAFDEPDPQRMQRKCDQLEARRATERAFAAQQLQARRIQDRENKQSVQQAQHERRTVEREKRDNLLQAYRSKKEPDSRYANPYPVRSGTVALSRSEVNLSTSPKDRRKISQCSDSNKRISRQPNGTDVRSSIQRFRPKFGGKLSLSCTQSAVGLRGSGDGEAVEANECEEDERDVLKSNEAIHEDDPLTNGNPTRVQLPSGLSLSSLHRLGATDSPSSGPGLTVSNTAQPKLFVKPKAKSNRMVIVNAIGHACLAGAVNEPMKQAALKELAATEGTHFMILFRDSRCQYRAVYSFDLESEELRLICGTGPRKITHDMANRFFKYNSGGKHFTEITSTNHLSPVVDAITIHDSLWTKSGGQSAALNLLSGGSGGGGAVSAAGRPS